MLEVEKLQAWYLSQCNDDWEHTYGIKIETLDNPGWSLVVDLTEASILGRQYSGYAYGIGDEAENSGDNWVVTKVEGNQFVAYGGPKKLNELIEIFLSWASE